MRLPDHREVGFATGGAARGDANAGLGPGQRSTSALVDIEFLAQQRVIISDIKVAISRTKEVIDSTNRLVDWIDCYVAPFYSKHRPPVAADSTMTTRGRRGVDSGRNQS